MQKTSPRLNHEEICLKNASDFIFDAASDVIIVVVFKYVFCFVYVRDYMPVLDPQILRLNFLKKKIKISPFYLFVFFKKIVLQLT